MQKSHGFLSRPQFLFYFFNDSVEPKFESNAFSFFDGMDLAVGCTCVDAWKQVKGNCSDSR